MQTYSPDMALHDRIVVAQVKAYTEDGAEILAVNLDGWTRPARIGGHVPDIVAKHQGRIVYNEVETCETIKAPVTRRQCEETAKAGILHMTVPRTCLQATELMFARWKIPVELMWSYDGV